MGQSLQRLSALEEAMAQGDAALPAVTAILNSGVSVNSMMKQRSALYFSIERGSTMIAELLLKRGAGVKRGYFTETPLHCAAAKGNLHIAAMLIEKGAKVNARNHNGCTPLWLAASQGHYSVVHLLLQQPGVDVDCPCGDVFLKSIAKSSALCQAIQRQCVDICEELLAKGANVNLSDVNGCSPLHHASLLGNAALARLLIQHGCALDSVDMHGCTPLHAAVDHDQYSTASVLIHAGCDINFPCSGNWNFSPLHIAAKRGNPDITAILCSAKGIEVDRKDQYSLTPLITACKHSRPHGLKKLLSSATDINSVGRVGLWPFSQATCLEKDPRQKWRHLHRWQMRASDKRGGDGNCSGRVHGACGCGDADEGDTTHSAVQTGKTPSLVESGCCSELEDIQSIIWYVAHAVGADQESPHLDVLHVLITGGADLHVKDDFHKTAVEYALNLGNFQSALLLICHGASVDDDLIKSVLSANYLKPKAIMEGFMYPLVVALVWSSASHHRLFNAYHLRITFHNYHDDLPLWTKDLLEQPLSLARLCRNVVREALIHKSSCSIAPLVVLLPVPKTLKQFLLLSDVLELLFSSSRRLMSE